MAGKLLTVRLSFSIAIGKRNLLFFDVEHKQFSQLYEGPHDLDIDVFCLRLFNTAASIATSCSVKVRGMAGL